MWHGFKPSLYYMFILLYDGSGSDDCEGRIYLLNGLLGLHLKTSSSFISIQCRGFLASHVSFSVAGEKALFKHC